MKREAIKGGWRRVLSSRWTQLGRCVLRERSSGNRLASYPVKPIGRFSSSVPFTFVGELRLVHATLDSTAGGRPIRSFLIGALDYFLAHAVERARAGKRGGGCEFVSLDDDAAENSYQLSAPEGITAEKAFDARWAAALFEAAFARLRGELRSEGKGHLFEALQSSLLGREDASYQQIADTLSLSLEGLKTVIHRLRSRFRALLPRRSGAHGHAAQGDGRGASLPLGRAEGLRLQPWRPSQ
jgi:DNA-directed RNA polymerase specialized sigma24 family protein